MTLRSICRQLARRALDALHSARQSIHHRRILRRGRYRANIAEQSIQFVVSSSTELIRIDEFTDPVFITRLIGALRPGDALFDVGANIGVITLAAALARPDIVVHAFEPEPRNARRLRENVALNQLSNVIVHEVALGRQKGELSLLVHGEVGEGTHRLSLSQPVRNQTNVRVPVIALEEIIAQTGARPMVVKIDVEGAEMEVLLGMQQLLLSGAVRDLFVEIHYDRILTEGFDEPAIIRWLEAMGYRLAWSEPLPRETQSHFVRDGEIVSTAK